MGLVIRHSRLFCPAATEAPKRLGSGEREGLGDNLGPLNAADYKVLARREDLWRLVYSRWVLFYSGAWWFYGNDHGLGGN
jgi:hypothetical protein